MKQLILIMFFSVVFSQSYGQDLDNKTLTEQSLDGERTLNLGGVIVGSPAQAKVYQGPPIPARNSQVADTNMSFQDMFRAITYNADADRGGGRKPAEAVSYEELEKMSKIPYKDPDDEYALYFFILALLIFLYYFRQAIKKALIIILSYFFYTNSKNKENKKVESIKPLNLKDKLTALKDLENLYSTGVINETEFTKLKSDILN